MDGRIVGDDDPFILVVVDGAPDGEFVVVTVISVWSVLLDTI